MSVAHTIEGRVRRLAMVAALALAAAAVSGCRDRAGLDNETASILADPEKRHPISFSSRTEALYVELAPAGDGLSSGQQTDVLRFVERFKVEGQGRLKISGPGSAKGHLAASRSLRQVEDIARGAGLPPDAIALARSGGTDSAYGPAVRIAYERPIAVPPACGDWPHDLGENRERLPYANFGCATQRNLALSVATARDLQVPQEEAARAGEVRHKVWSKYAGSGSGGGGAAPAVGAPAAPAAPGGAPPAGN